MFQPNRESNKDDFLFFLYYSANEDETYEPDYKFEKVILRTHKELLMKKYNVSFALKATFL